MALVVLCAATPLVSGQNSNAARMADTPVSAEIGTARASFLAVLGRASPAPDAVRVWTCQPPKPLTLFDSPPAGAKAEPIRLIGVRNGRFSGRIVLASTKPITAVKVKVGDLAAEDGKGGIPAARLLVRFALPPERMPSNFFVPEYRFDALAAEPPKEVAPRNVKPPAGTTAAGAVAMLPVWVTVLIPPVAAPGTYRGKVTVEADGLPATDIPLMLKVHDWQVPDPKDFTCSSNLVWQSHESTALRYNVPLWSDRHFELMGQGLELTRPVNNSFCVVHLISGAYHQGNSQSMVRWIDKGGGKFDHDFTILDRYLALYEKKLGKPAVLLLSVFHPYVDAKDKEGKVTGSASVSLLNPETGQVDALRVPEYGTPESVAFWKPVLDEIFQRLEKRGWKDAVVIGTASDNGPRTPAPFAMLKAIWPECRLMFSGHPNPTRLKAAGNEYVPVACREHVWGAGRLRQGYGKPVRYPQWAFSRAGAGACNLIQFSELAAHRANPEMCMQCGNAGIGRCGVDFYLPPGRKTPLSGDAGAHIGPSASITSLTAAGPDGPLATTRLEMLAEGMQTREAIAALLSAIDTAKLDPALAAKCSDLLNARATRNLKFQPATYNLERGTPYIETWQEEEDRLFGLCAETARAVRQK